MPVETIARIKSRIKGATPLNPISVFVVKVEKIRKLDALYANTSEAMRRRMALKPFHPSHQCETSGHIEEHFAEEYIGDFHNNMNMNDVGAFLKAAINLAPKEPKDDNNSD